MKSSLSIFRRLVRNIGGKLFNAQRLARAQRVAPIQTPLHIWPLEKAPEHWRTRKQGRDCQAMFVAYVVECGGAPPLSIRLQLSLSPLPFMVRACQTEFTRTSVVHFCFSALH